MHGGYGRTLDLHASNSTPTWDIIKSYEQHDTHVGYTRLRVPYTYGTLCIYIGNETNKFVGVCTDNNDQ